MCIRGEEAKRQLECCVAGGREGRIPIGYCSTEALAVTGWREGHAMRRCGA